MVLPAGVGDEEEGTCVDPHDSVNHWDLGEGDGMDDGPVAI